MGSMALAERRPIRQIERRVNPTSIQPLDRDTAPGVIDLGGCGTY